MNGHTYELHVFKNKFNDVQTDGKGEINMAQHNCFENCNLSDQ